MIAAYPQAGLIAPRLLTERPQGEIYSGLYRFLGITVLLDVKDIPQVGPL
jgi:hypothetical protein